MRFKIYPETLRLTDKQHVVGAGPFLGYCIFDNHEEVC